MRDRRTREPKKERRTGDTRDLDRRAVLDAASRLVAEEGPSALTMRRLATELGASTMVLYSRFESREELVVQLLLEAFSRFAETLARVHEEDPWTNLRELGHAYRRFARENPTYYRLMWNVPHDSPTKTTLPAELSREGSRAFQALMHAVTRLLARLDRSAREAEPLAVAIWSSVHGFVSLELAGALPPGPPTDAAWERTLDVVASPFPKPC